MVDGCVVGLMIPFVIASAAFGATAGGMYRGLGAAAPFPFPFDPFGFCAGGGK